MNFKPSNISLSQVPVVKFVTAALSTIEFTATDRDLQPLTSPATYVPVWLVFNHRTEQFLPLLLLTNSHLLLSMGAFAVNDKAVLH